MNSKIESCRTLLKSNWREKKLKSLNPTQTTVAMPQVLVSHCCTKVVTICYLPQCVVRVRDLASFAVALSSMVVDNDYQRNFDDLKTPRDGLARHGNVKEIRVEVSNEIWTETQRIDLPSPNFQHAENLPTNATDNFGRLRSLPDSSATTDGNTRRLAANSKLQFAAYRTLPLPPIRHSVSQA